MKKIAQIEKGYLRDDLPPFSSGDTVRVHYRIKEGDKERVQVFQGTVIGRRGGGTGETFTVRKISSGIGVERIFPLNSPNIARIERIRTGKVRRAKLYYLRGLRGKSARIKEDLAERAVADAGSAAAAEEIRQAKAAAKAEAEKPAPKPEPAAEPAKEEAAEEKAE